MKSGLFNNLFFALFFINQTIDSFLNDLISIYYDEKIFFIIQAYLYIFSIYIISFPDN